MLKLSFKILILLFAELAFSQEAKISGEKVESAPQLKQASAPLFNIEKSNKAVVAEYLKIHKSYFKQLCRGGTEEKFWDMYRTFRGDGYYIPSLPDESLDRETVSRFIPEIRKKIEWIESQIKNVKGIKTFSPIFEEVKKLENDLDELLKYKHAYDEGIQEKERISAQNKSKYKLIAFKNKVKKLIESIPFMQSYRFPVDHLQLRENYDEFKHTTKVDEKKRANQVYFYRKIVQDGAHNKGTGGSDNFFRAVLDTVYLHIDKEHDFLTENLRYDLSYMFRYIDKHLHKHGRSGIVKRLTYWKERMERQLDFYVSLKNDKVKMGDHFETSLQILDAKSKARYTLKEFVISKQDKVYRFWMNQPELYRALFSLETILFNEVGRIDGVDALERKDVAQVAINRTKMPKYNQLKESEPLYEKLAQMEGFDKEKYRWLNVMLKEGEFSFTYFFITGNVKIYCPDQTRLGRYLRKKNLNISLELLRNPNYRFDAVRYFSRASMLGRMSMDSLWEDYEPIPERPGLEVKKSKKLKRLYMNGDYEYLYKFKDPDGESYRVVSILDRTYVMPIKEIKFYKYRNPHYFKYFRSKNSL